MTVVNLCRMGSYRVDDRGLRLVDPKSPAFELVQDPSMARFLIQPIPFDLEGLSVLGRRGRYRTLENFSGPEYQGTL